MFKTVLVAALTLLACGPGAGTAEEACETFCAFMAARDYKNAAGLCWQESWRGKDAVDVARARASLAEALAQGQTRAPRDWGRAEITARERVAGDVILTVRVPSYGTPGVKPAVFKMRFAKVAARWYYITEEGICEIY